RPSTAKESEIDRLLEQEASSDPRAAQAIRALWPVERAAVTLSAALRNATGAGAAGVASALHELTRSTSLDRLRQVLFDEQASESDRIHALEALAQLPGIDVNFSLAAALDEPVPELRKRAANALFSRLGLALSGGRWPSLQAAGVRELKRIVEAG